MLKAQTIHLRVLVCEGCQLHVPHRLAEVNQWQLKHWFYVWDLHHLLTREVREGNCIRSLPLLNMAEKLSEDA